MRWSLVGRDVPLRRAMDVLEMGTASGVILAGPAGVGKSRLAAEVARLAETEGFHVVAVSGSPSTRAVPFGAFVHLVPSVVASDRLQLLQLTVASLRRSAGEHRLLLTVDDAQELDDSSLALVHLLATTSDAALCLTLRTGGETPAGLVHLWKDDHLDRIDLTSLTDESIANLVGQELGTVSDEGVERLVTLAGGNPLLLKELLLAGRQSGFLEQAEGTWHVTSSEFGRSPRLRDLVETRLAGLTEAGRDLFERLAVGSPLPREVVNSIDEAGALPELRRAELVVEGDESVAVAHPIYAEVVQDEVGEAGVIEMRNLLGDEVLATGPDDPSLVLTSISWKLDAGACDAELALRGGNQALAAFDGALAQRFAEAARAHETSWRPMALLARSLFVQQRPVEAEDVFRRIDPPPADPIDELSVVSTRALNLAFGLRDPAGAQAVLADAAERADPESAAALLIESALFDALRGDFHAVLNNAGPFVQREDIAAINRLRALIPFTLAQGMCAQLREFDELIELAADLAVQYQSELPMAEVQVAINRAFGLAALGRIDEALEHVASGHERSVREAGVVPLWSGQHGAVLLQAGFLQQAADLHLQRERHLTDFDPFRTNPMHRAIFAVVLATLGRADEAQELVDLALGNEPHPEPRLAVHAGRARGWVAAQRGQIDRAVEVLRETGEAAIKATHVLWGCEPLHDVVRLGRPGLVVADLEVAVSATECAPYLEAMVDHARLLVDENAEGLEAVAQRFAECGARLLAAEAMAQAAVLHDDPTMAAQAALRSRLWQRECGGPVTPALEARPDGLTDREMEIGGWVAKGLTSREVAEELFLSARTVDNHLRRIYQKLGIDERSQLADLWGG